MLDEAQNLFNEHINWQLGTELNSDFGLAEEPRVLNLHTFSAVIKA